MRAAGDQTDGARPRRRTQPHQPDVGVGAALRHRQTGGEPEVRRRLGRHAADEAAHRDALGRPLVRKVVQIDCRQQRGRPAAKRHLARRGRRRRRRAVAMPARRDVAAAGDEAAGHAEVEVVLALANRRGARPDLGLVLLEPERLRQHPLCAQRARAVAVDRQRRVAAALLEDLRALRAGARVHPQQARPQRRAVGAERHHRARRRVQAEGRNFVGRAIRGGNRLANGGAHPFPPVVGRLLGPARLRVRRRVRNRLCRKRTAVLVEYGGTRALGADVDGDDDAGGE